MSDWSESPNVSEETYDAVQWGKKLERERIITLLETEATIYADGLLDPAEVIALIKGELK